MTPAYNVDTQGKSRMRMNESQKKEDDSLPMLFEAFDWLRTRLGHCGHRLGPTGGTHLV